MQTATSETESKSLDLSICVHHYTLRAPCPKGQGNWGISNSTWNRALFHALGRRSEQATPTAFSKRSVQ